VNSSTWAGVLIGGIFIALTLAVFGLSLVPGALSRIHGELASWPEQARDLRADATALFRRGRHAGTPSADLPADNEPDPEPVEPDRSEDVVVIRDNSATRALPVAPERSDEGATEDWSPRAAVEAVERVEEHDPDVTAAHTPPDIAELTLLADFDEIVNGLRAVPKELVAFAAVVDESMAVAGMDGELHKRWRATAFDVPTGEHRRVLAPA
jgi:hypothetical protein